MQLQELKLSNSGYANFFQEIEYELQIKRRDECLKQHRKTYCITRRNVRKKKIRIRRRCSKKKFTARRKRKK